MDRKTVDIQDHALYNIGYDQVAVQYLSSRINYCSGGKCPQLKWRKTMAENKNPVITIEMTNGDIIKAELYPDVAPNTVNNFLSLVNKGFYNGLIFHRVIKGFMIQGGGMNMKMEEKATHAPIKNEADNGLANERGTIAMARTNDPDSATAQFFINVANNDFLNHKNETPSGYGYAVFGKVIQGQDVVDRIKSVSTGSYGPYQDVPKTPVIIKSIVPVQ